MIRRERSEDRGFENQSEKFREYKKVGKIMKEYGWKMKGKQLFLGREGNNGSKMWE